ncbi:MAG TPA: cell division ATP-binding protein FtsE [Patescibacteria group bacterium]
MINLSNVTKVFGTGFAGLSDISLSIDKGEFVFLVGQTGSGKTTLLRLLIREMLPTEGSIMIGDWDIVALPESKVPHLRKKIGIIFQDLKLLRDRTIFENVLLPLQVAGRGAQEAANRVEELLEEVGLLDQKEKFPVQLSGGELQRVAIARALALSPELLLADEPTGNLDEKTAFEIVDLFDRINKNGITVLMATHNPQIVEKLKKRIVELQKGKLIKDTKKPATHNTQHAPENTKKVEEPEKKHETKSESNESKDTKNHPSDLKKEFEGKKEDK